LPFWERVLIAAGEHGHALREHERGEEVAHLALAQVVDLGIVGGAFRAHVPTVVVVGAVGVVVAVGLVVLVVVADEVAEREAVVRGDEVDAGVGVCGRRTGRGRWSR
jgi:hypothetical protein